MLHNRISYFYYCSCLMLLPLLIIGSENPNVINEETRLMRMLLNEKDYLKKVRPSQMVIVDIRFVFNQIISMVEKEQIIVTNCFVDQKWIDPRLVWNPLDFQNITWIRIPAVSVWYPDTFLYNTADNAGFLLPQESQNVIVSYNGTVFWPLPLAQLRTRCRMTIKHFPFDEQTCDMIFGSWSHTSSLIHYRFWEQQPEIPQYTPNNEWKLLAVSQSIKTVDYPNWVEPDTFFEINFTILIVRKPLQAIYNTVVPAIMLTTLTLVSFFIPFAQEMQIGISIMLAYSVFSLRLSEDVPSQSDSVHLISFYLTICMFFSLSAMTWFAIANKLREKKRLPYWLRWLVLDYICWMVCATSMHRKAVHNAKQQSKNSSKSQTTVAKSPSQPLLTTNSMELSNNSYSQQVCLPMTVTRNAPLQPTSMSEIQSTSHQTMIIPGKVWIRQKSSRDESTIINESDRKTLNSHSSKKSRQLKSPSPSKSQESLYAVYIINRLVFFMFLFIVIVINIYTWFFYSRTVQTKLFDNRTTWTCYDESRLEIVHCNETTL